MMQWDMLHRLHLTLLRLVFRKGNQAVLILAVILLVFISPFVKGAVGGILTFAVGILLLPFWLIVGLGIGAVVGKCPRSLPGKNTSPHIPRHQGRSKSCGFRSA